MSRTWLVLGVLVIAACGPRATDVAGIWEGTWAASDRQSTGTLRVDITQRGKTITGEIRLSLDWLPQARIEGIVEGERVRWGVLRGRLVLLTFEGRVTGDSAEGTYAIGAGPGGAAPGGSWTARRVRRR